MCHVKSHKHKTGTCSLEHLRPRSLIVKSNLHKKQGNAPMSIFYVLK